MQNFRVVYIDDIPFDLGSVSGLLKCIIWLKCGFCRQCGSSGRPEVPHREKFLIPVRYSYRREQHKGYFVDSDSFIVANMGP